MKTYRQVPADREGHGTLAQCQQVTLLLFNKLMIADLRFLLYGDFNWLTRVKAASYLIYPKVSAPSHL